MSEGLRSTPPGSLLAALREEVVRLPNGFRDDDGVWYETGRRDRAVKTLDGMIEALREIGTPASVPEHFDPLDWWRHTASRRGEIARDALGVTVEELILDGE